MASCEFVAFFVLGIGFSSLSAIGGVSHQRTCPSTGSKTHGTGSKTHARKSLFTRACWPGVNAIRHDPANNGAGSSFRSLVHWIAERTSCAASNHASPRGGTALASSVELSRLHATPQEESS